MRCALGKHDIHGAAKHLDGKYLAFVRKLRKEIRRADPICTRCYNDVINMYNSKLASAIKKAKAKRSLEKKKSEVSDPSVSSATSTTNNNDSIDNMVFRTPRNPNLKAVVTESRTGYDSNSSSSTCSTVIGIIATQSQSSLSNQGNPQSSQSSLDMEPSTSAAAKRKRDIAPANTRLAAPQSYVTDAWSEIDSPAVLNGSKLPEVQPILKRRPFVTGNKDIMDIYLANLTGG